MMNQPDYTSKLSAPVASPLKQPVRVLIYAPVLGRGGVRRLFDQLIGAWLKNTDRAHWQFKVLSHPIDERGASLDLPEDMLIPLRFEGELPQKASGWIPFVTHNQLVFWDQLRRHAEDADVVWLPHPWYSLRIPTDQMTVKAHLVPTVHDFAFDTLDAMRGVADAYRREMSAFALASSRVIFSSRTNYHYAVDRYQLVPEKGRVVYLGAFTSPQFSVTDDEAARVRAAHNLPDSYLLMMHAIGHKGLPTVVEALDDLKGSDPAHFRSLVVAGLGTERFLPDAPYSDPSTEALRKRIRDSRLVMGQDIRVLGYVDDADVGGLYRGAAMTISASYSEAGISATLFEAFAAQCPAVFSDLPVYIERLGTDRRYGVHFRVGDPIDLARAITEVLAQPAETAKRVMAAYQFYQARTWRDIALDYLTVFAEVLQTPGLKATLDFNIQQAQRWGIDPMADSDPAPVHAASGIDRFKIWMIEKALPKVNLTSYRNVLRSRALAEQLAAENANMQQRLQELAAVQQQVEKSCAELRENKQQLEERIRSDSGQISAILEQIAQIRAMLHDPQETKQAMQILETFYGDDADVAMNWLRDTYQASLDENTPYWDVRKTVRAATAVLQPKTYLEIGTRRGWSLAQYFAVQPQGRAYVFDLWIQAYGDVPQGSPELVRDKMKQVVGEGHTPDIEFISGNSHDTLNDCFNGLIPLQSGSCPTEFDLIVVDGDHTNVGAWWDLYDTFPRVKVGGAIIFDDLDSTGIDEMTYTVSSYQRPPLPEGVSGLRNVWLYMQSLHPNFVFIDCYSYRFPCGIGIRLF
jgi:glycosyltransferase involved in cell wall biosynthesis/predicted O-methyltransferase YrrM